MKIEAKYILPSERITIPQKPVFITRKQHTFDKKPNIQMYTGENIIVPQNKTAFDMKIQTKYMSTPKKITIPEKPVYFPDKNQIYSKKLTFQSHQKHHFLFPPKSSVLGLDMQKNRISTIYRLNTPTAEIYPSSIHKRNKNLSFQTIPKHPFLMPHKSPELEVNVLNEYSMSQNMNYKYISQPRAVAELLNRQRVHAVSKKDFSNLEKLKLPITIQTCHFPKIGKTIENGENGDRDTLHELKESSIEQESAMKPHLKPRSEATVSSREIKIFPESPECMLRRGRKTEETLQFFDNLQIIKSTPETSHVSTEYNGMMIQGVGRESEREKTRKLTHSKEWLVKKISLANRAKSSVGDDVERREEHLERSQVPEISEQSGQITGIPEQSGQITLQDTERDQFLTEQDGEKEKESIPKEILETGRESDDLATRKKEETKKPEAGISEDSLPVVDTSRKSKQDMLTDYKRHVDSKESLTSSQLLDTEHGEELKIKESMEIVSKIPSVEKSDLEAAERSDSGKISSHLRMDKQASLMSEERLDEVQSKESVGARSIHSLESLKEEKRNSSRDADNLSKQIIKTDKVTVPVSIREVDSKGVATARTEKVLDQTKEPFGTDGSIPKVKFGSITGTEAKVSVGSDDGTPRKPSGIIDGTPTEQVTTVEGTPRKPSGISDGTPSKQVTTVEGTPRKPSGISDGTPSKQVTTVEGTPRKPSGISDGTPTEQVTTVEGTPRKPSGISDRTPTEQVTTVEGTPRKPSRISDGTPTEQVTTVEGTPRKPSRISDGTPTEQVTTVEGTPRKPSGISDGTPSGQVATVEGTPRKLPGIIDGTPSKQVTTVEGTPRKLPGISDGTPSGQVATVEGTPRKPSGIIDGTPTEQVATVEGTPAEGIKLKRLSQPERLSAAGKIPRLMEYSSQDTEIQTADETESRTDVEKGFKKSISKKYLSKYKNSRQKGTSPEDIMDQVSDEKHRRVGKKHAKRQMVKLQVEMSRELEKHIKPEKSEITFRKREKKQLQDPEYVRDYIFQRRTIAARERKTELKKFPSETYVVKEPHLLEKKSIEQSDEELYSSDESLIPQSDVQSQESLFSEEQEYIQQKKVSMALNKDFEKSSSKQKIFIKLDSYAMNPQRFQKSLLKLKVIQIFETLQTNLKEAPKPEDITEFILNQHEDGKINAEEYEVLRETVEESFELAPKVEPEVIPGQVKKPHGKQTKVKIKEKSRSLQKKVKSKKFSKKLIGKLRTKVEKKKLPVIPSVERRRKFNWVADQMRLLNELRIIHELTEPYIFSYYVNWPVMSDLISSKKKIKK